MILYGMVYLQLQDMNSMLVQIEDYIFSDTLAQIDNANLKIASGPSIQNQLILVSSTNANYCSIQFTNSSAQNLYIGLGGAAIGGNAQGNAFIQSPAAIVFSGNTGTKAAMFIDANANVGINTNSCSSRFGVFNPSGTSVFSVDDTGQAGCVSINASGQLICYIFYSSKLQ